MKDELFQELIESVREGGDILRGKAEPARKYEIPSNDIKEVRKNIGLSQQKFAELFGISVSTLRNWEQGRRKPSGSANVLLRVLQHNPKAVLESIR